MVAMHHRRETHEHRSHLASGEHLGPGQVAEVVSDGESAMGAGTASMHHPLGNTLAVEALELLDQLNILQQHRPSGACGLRVLVVAHRRAIVAGQRGGLYGKGQHTGGEYAQYASLGKTPEAKRSSHVEFL